MLTMNGDQFREQKTHSRSMKHHWLHGQNLTVRVCTKAINGLFFLYWILISVLKCVKIDLVINSFNKTSRHTTLEYCFAAKNSKRGHWFATHISRRLPLTPLCEVISQINWTPVIFGCLTSSRQTFAPKWSLHHLRYLEK